VVRLRPKLKFLQCIVYGARPGSPVGDPGLFLRTGQYLVENALRKIEVSRTGDSCLDNMHVRDALQFDAFQVIAFGKVHDAQGFAAALAEDIHGEIMAAVAHDSGRRHIGRAGGKAADHLLLQEGGNALAQFLM